MTARKVAILGGGMGSLAAAWELTNSPESRDQYEITVYQRDWLLGGKGASVRNSARGNRIEEHGLHVLMGFYDNALYLLKSVYEEASALPTSSELGRVLGWSSVLQGWDKVTLFEPPQLTGDGWESWTVSFPTRPGGPGEEPPGEQGVEALIQGLRDWFRQFTGRWEPIKGFLEDHLGLNDKSVNGTHAFGDSRASLRAARRRFRPQANP